MAEENLDTWVKKIQEIILNTKPDGWQTDPQKRFKPVKHNPVIIKEFGKTRVVYVPTMVELWIQHVIVMIGKQLSDELFIVSWKGFPEGAASYQTLDRKRKGDQELCTGRYPAFL